MIEILPLLIVAATLGSGVVILLAPDEAVRLRTTLNLAGSGLTLALVGLLVAAKLEGRDFSVRLPFLPGANLVLQTDALSTLFVVLSATLWAATTLYAVGYMRKGPGRSRFFGFFAFSVSATMGLALAGDLLTFVVFYELLTVATFPLVVHKGDEASLRAGRIYLAYALGGGAALLIGTMALHALQGGTGFVVGGMLAQAPARPSDAALTLIFVLLVGGLGVKAALVPLHGWLPIAMAAPAPVSALLHAVAVVKAGAFGIVRVVHDLYGVSLATSLGLLAPLAALAAATILWGSFRALMQQDLKKRLAYSTVSQVSYIALGVALAHPAAALGGVLHLIHQGVMKITLFFCAGAIAETTGARTVDAMDGLGRRMPWTMAAFTVAALGMIGLPPTAGFVTKWHVVQGALAAGAPWVMGVMLASSALNAAYFLPILRRVWFRPGPEGAPRRRGFETAPLMLLPPLLTAAATLAAALFATSTLSPLGWTQALVLAEFGYGGAP